MGRVREAFPGSYTALEADLALDSTDDATVNKLETKNVLMPQLTPPTSCPKGTSAPVKQTRWGKDLTSATGCELARDSADLVPPIDTAHKVLATKRSASHGAETLPSLRPTTPYLSSYHSTSTPISAESSPQSSVLSAARTPGADHDDLPSSPTTPITPRHSAESKLCSSKAALNTEVKFERAGVSGHEILHLKPTEEQWRDFPSILKVARSLRAFEDGCFKVTLPQEAYEALPDRGGRVAKGHAYKIKQIKRNSFWQVTTVPAEGTFDPVGSGPVNEDDVHVAIGKLKKMFNKNNGKRLRQVLYRVDIPAWTSEQRQVAGVPQQSPIHPLKGDMLEQTKAVIPGIHTPYVYESAAHFGATFQVHAEDYRLVSLNHLYKGRKIWIVVPSTEIAKAEAAWNRKQRCSQFMRHRAEFFFPEKLDKLGIPYRIIDQRPGETIVVLPDAYHEGFSTGYTLAEAKNYADPEWSTERYQACDQKCMLLTAIPAPYMAILKTGERRIDLCAHYDSNIDTAVDEDAEGEEVSEDFHHSLSQQPTPTPPESRPEPFAEGKLSTVPSIPRKEEEEPLKRACTEDSKIDGPQQHAPKRFKVC